MQCDTALPARLFRRPGHLLPSPALLDAAALLCVRVQPVRDRLVQLNARLSDKVHIAKVAEAEYGVVNELKVAGKHGFRIEREDRYWVSGAAKFLAGRIR